MLTNATLLRIDTPAPPLTSGQRQYVTGSSLALRVFLGADDAAVKYEGDAKRDEFRNAVMRVLSSAFSGLALGNLAHVVIQGDGDSAATYTVQSVQRCPKGALGFIEAKLLRD